MTPVPRFMLQTIDRMFRTIRRERLLVAGDRVAVAVSGGSDSVALMHLMREAAPRLGCVLAGLCHLNHRLRGAAADEDERFCRALAARLGLPIEVDAADVGADARSRKTSIEVAARHARYDFYRRAGETLEADRIALGHTRDDQAETYFLRLLRGAGPGGLAGMRPRSGRIIRPALDLTRDELRRYLHGIGEAFREDASNLDRSIPRNRIRHELVPYLRREFAPAIAEIAARNAVIARLDSEWLEQEAARAAESLVRVDDGRVAIDAAGLMALPPALSMRVVRSALEPIGSAGVGLEGVMQVLEAAGGERREVDLPGCRLRREGPTVWLAKRQGRRPDEPADEPFDYPLAVPGRVIVPEAGVVIEVETRRALDSATDRPADGAAVLAIDAGQVSLPLAVRSWRPGDRFRPHGLKGHKKLQDFFVDRKVPRADRARVPIVVDREGRIVWIVGHAAADDFRAAADSPAVLILKARPLGGAR